MPEPKINHKKHTLFIDPYGVHFLGEYCHLICRTDLNHIDITSILNNDQLERNISEYLILRLMEYSNKFT